VWSSRATPGRVWSGECDLVERGLVECGLLEYDLVECGLVECRLVEYGVVRLSVVDRNVPSLSLLCALLRKVEISRVTLDLAQHTARTLACL